MLWIMRISDHVVVLVAVQRNTYTALAVNSDLSKCWLDEQDCQRGGTPITTSFLGIGGELGCRFAGH